MQQKRKGQWLCFRLYRFPQESMQLLPKGYTQDTSQQQRNCTPVPSPATRGAFKGKIGARDRARSLWGPSHKPLRPPRPPGQVQRPAFWGYAWRNVPCWMPSRALLMTAFFACGLIDANQEANKWFIIVQAEGSHRNDTTSNFLTHQEALMSPKTLLTWTLTHMYVHTPWQQIHGTSRKEHLPISLCCTSTV